jgi:hypothetical protein
MDVSCRYEVNPETGCWNWTGARDVDGYGRVFGGRTSGREEAKAHRWMYERERGPLPDELHLHHRCENPRCVNPEHLRPLTKAEHRAVHGGGSPEARRGPSRVGDGERCVNGHELSAAIVYVSPSGTERCRECARAATRRRRQKKAVGAA